MKRLTLLVTPLMTLSLLASCGGGDKPKPEQVEFLLSSEQPTTVEDKTATVYVDWKPTTHSIKFNSFTFVSEPHKDNTIAFDKESGARPMPVSITFSDEINEDINGTLSFAYEDVTAKTKGNSSVEVTIKKPPIPYSGLALTATEDNSSIAYSITGSLPDIHIQTSADGTNWTDWDGAAITLNNGEFRYIRNTANALSQDLNNYFKFVMTGEIAASGDISSMINFAPLSDDCYRSMFDGCDLLTTAPSLPATALADNCYNHMFDKCTSLTQAPDLPATTLADHCYFYMFYNCDSLTTAPSLPATTLASYCYASMFSNCDFLVTAPKLSAPSLADRCYESMFDGCRHLKVKEGGEGTLIFFCPSDIPKNAVECMFRSTGGTFSGTPSPNKYYYWY